MRKEIYTCLCDPYFDEIEGRYAKHTMFSSRTPAHEFFDMHVAPNHGAWQAHTTDIRLAMNVVCLCTIWQITSGMRIPRQIQVASSQQGLLVYIVLN